MGRKRLLISWGLLGVLLSAAISAAAMANPPDAIRPCSAAENKLDDVYCIGHRHVARRTFISVQKGIELGQRYADRIDRSSRILKDPVITEYVNRVEQNIALNSDAKIPITVGIIKSPYINAMTLPGGFIFVNTGTLQKLSSEAELAAVLAHETGHVAGRDAVANMTRQDLLQYATIPLLFTPMTYPVYLGVTEGLNFGIPMAWLKYRRGEEHRADFLGVQYLWKAGYDPNAFLGVFSKIIQQTRSIPGSMPGIFMNHPPTKERIISIEEEIENLLPPRKHYLVSTSEFQSMQRRLNTILSRENQVEIAANKNRPKLRRREPRTSPQNGSIHNSGNDKPPILGTPPKKS